MSGLLRDSSDEKVRARWVKRFFDELGIAYGGGHDCKCVVGPDSYAISHEDHERLVLMGNDFYEWSRASIELINESYRTSEFRWLAEVVEGPVSEDAKAVHRRAHSTGAVSVPLLVRPDMCGLGSTVEVQIPGSGWGYMAALFATVGSSRSYYCGPMSGFAKAVSAAVGSSAAEAAYILYNDPHYHEVRYFCECCRTAAIPAQVRLFFKKIPSPGEVKFVRRPPLEDLVSYEGACGLIRDSFADTLHVEPDMSLLFDQKVACTFPFDERLRHRFSDNVRALFPESYLIHDNVLPRFEGEPMRWDDIAGMSRRTRQFIVKYAGAEKGKRAGGKAVYNLSDCSSAQACEVIAYALREWRDRRSSWLIQRRVQKKVEVRFLDEKADVVVTRPYYPLFRPLYLLRPGGSEIVSHCALFRKEWKVHGSSDAVNLPVEVGVPKELIVP